MFIVKYKPDGMVDWYKARMVAHGFTQEYGVDYAETFSPVARLNFVRVILFIAINQSWKLNELDVNNAFLHGDL